MKTGNTLIKDYLDDMKNLEKTYIGFPNNMAYDYSPVSSSSHVYINNCGDPFSTLAWKKHSKLYEQEVLKFFLKLYQISEEDGWGYMTAGGTEGNMEGLLLGREKYSDGILYFSNDTHYSIEKISNILRMPKILVPSLKTGEIDYEQFEKLLVKDKPVIMNVNCGTTIKGAYDNLKKLIHILDKNKITKRYIHVDAALSGMILPFLNEAPKYDFNSGVDSIAISMHKFLGCPIMSGIVLSRKANVDNIKRKIEYINSHDTTILGSRNGQVPLYVWYLLNTYGEKRIAKDANTCIENAKYLNTKLNEVDYKSSLNQNSITVYFDKPNEFVVEKWQLACYDDMAHAVVMQHVDKEMINSFVNDIISFDLK
jgi:histidine decarboxylase